MTDQLVVISEAKLLQLFTSTLQSELSKIFPQHQQQPKEERKVVYRSGDYVAEHFDISLPTLDKYSQEGKNQIFYPIRIGRRVLYDQDELAMVKPLITTLLECKNRKKAA